MYDFSLFLFFRLREGGGGRTVPSVSRVFALALTSTETLMLTGAVSFPFPFFFSCVDALVDHARVSVASTRSRVAVVPS